MKRVLLFACDPGGANTVTPLAQPLTERGYRVLAYGRNQALRQLAAAGVPAVDLEQRVGEVTPESVASFLLDESPDFLITGTSAGDFTEKYLWKAAQCLRIPSFAILDQWVNYGIRFSPWGVSDLAAYHAAPSHPFLPSRIVVMDEFARGEMVRSGIAPPERILPLGQPHFETLFSRYDKLPPGELLKGRLGIASGELVMAFASEPLSQDYHEDPDRGGYWGFTERTTFGSLIAALRRTGGGRSIRILVKRHPRETAEVYGDLIRELPQGVSVEPYGGSDPLELIRASDLVCGMSSMMLIEAAVLGKPVISMLLGLKRESPFVLDRLGILSSARTEDALDERLARFLCHGSLPADKFRVARHPVKAILDEMERMI